MAAAMSHAERRYQGVRRDRCEPTTRVNIFLLL
jgi:hypothetical protein